MKFAILFHDHFTKFDNPLIFLPMPQLLINKKKEKSKNPRKSIIPDCMCHEESLIHNESTQQSHQKLLLQIVSDTERI